MERSPPLGQVQESLLPPDDNYVVNEPADDNNTLHNNNCSQTSHDNHRNINDHADEPTDADGDADMNLIANMDYKRLLTPDQMTAMLSNYSTSFNVVSISILLPILKSNSLYADQVTAETSSMCASALIAGMIFGQLGGGALGDLVGRRRGILWVMVLQIIGSLGGCFFIHVHDNGNDDDRGGNAIYWSVFEQLAAWRFLLGIGCGGVYPLAASLSSESQTQTNNQGISSNDRNGNSSGALALTPQQNIQRLKMLAATFSTQGVGFVSVPIVALTTLLISGPNRLEFVWRFILGFGAIPGIVLMYLRYKSFRMEQKEQEQEHNRLNEEELSEGVRGRNDDVDVEQDTDRTSDAGTTTRMSTNIGIESEIASETAVRPTSNLWTAIKTEDQLFMKLVGTAGTWFLFDVVFYGNTLFQPVVIKTAFGYDDGDDDGMDNDEFSNLVKNIRDSMILSTIALPGYFVSIALIGKRMCLQHFQTPKYIQMQGFACMAILYTTISFTWDSLTQHHWLLVFLYGGTFFFSNYGPNTTTFMLPSITFSPECRSTLNGISAASGKAGALLGSLMFDPISNKYGDATVMMLCALTSIFAGVITAYCCKPPRL